MFGLQWRQCASLSCAIGWGPKALTLFVLFWVFFVETFTKCWTTSQAVAVRATFCVTFRWCDQSSRFKPHEKFEDRLFSLFRNNISHANNSTGRQAPLPNAVSHFFSFYPPYPLIHFPSLHVILLMLFFFLSSWKMNSGSVTLGSAGVWVVSFLLPVLSRAEILAWPAAVSGLCKPHSLHKDRYRRGSLVPPSFIFRFLRVCSICRKF